jgi:RNA-splicing ligase RtcB
MSVAGIEKLCERVDAKVTQVNRSLGTLGGGNHFIEIGKDLNSEYWLTVHSGSRNFGLKIANYYQNLAAKQREHDICNKMKKEIDDIINSVTPTMREAEIQKVRDKYGVGSPKELSWLDDADEYLEAMYLAQHYASFNRAVILSSICKECNLTSIESIESIHNYIDPADKIIRKGAIRSYKDEYMVIPFNMRDGILICKGKSNPTWNFSAPHGAGRVMSRSIAKRSINLDDFKAQMNGIYSTSVCQGTLDEAPDAYKSAQIIEDAIGPTASIVNRIKPIYNLKA